MELNKNTIVGDIVKINYQIADVFNNHNIDFCCNGNRSLEVVCAEKNISTDQIIDEIQALDIKKDNDLDFDSLDLSFLIDYIYNAHHQYVRREGPKIVSYLDKTIDVHGNNHPELFQVRTLFIDSLEALSSHLGKEEQILFPYIKDIEEASKISDRVVEHHCGTVSNPIRQMMTEHDIEGERFRQISKLTNNYAMPEDGCNTYKLAMDRLKDFEENLHKHIHLENNILFPKAIAQEKV
ncbi:MAG: iron-sulfur cluster repair di-iron protein [Bacteroidales bacterium]